MIIPLDTDQVRLTTVYPWTQCRANSKPTLDAQPTRDVAFDNSNSMIIKINPSRQMI